MKTSLTLLALAALLPAAGAQNPLLTVLGPQLDDDYGRAVAGAGDVNADGFDDVIVGARMHDGVDINSGLARVYSGKDGAVLHTFLGTHVWQNLGHAVAGVGDLNADGYDDVVVGADRDNTGGSNAGAAFVYSGKTGAKLFSFFGSHANAFQGYDVAAAGDINLDGRMDIAVGAFAENLTSTITGAGRVRVYSGANGAVLLTLSGSLKNESYGWAVDGAGDVDGDGRADIIIGTGTGSMEVRSGLDGHLLFKKAGLGAEEYGYDVAGLGDVNFDGFADVAVGSPSLSNGPGRCEVLLGPTGTLKWNLVGSNPNDDFGVSVDGVGDVDKDGCGDLVVGAHGYDFSRGMARVFSGRTGGLLYGTLQGDDYGDDFGLAVAGAGDLNGDGWVDIVVGAPDQAATPAGAGYARSFDVLVNAPDLGFGGPGTAKLKMYGSPLTGFGEMDLSLKGAAPNKQAMLIASIAQLPISVKGGILVPDITTALLVPLVTSPQGSILITGIPGGGGPVNVNVQCVVKDPAQPHGWAFSNAIRPQFLP